MSWDQYSGKQTVGQLRDRAPLIAVGGAIIGLLFGFTALASNNAAESATEPTTTVAPAQPQRSATSATPSSQTPAAVAPATGTTKTPAAGTKRKANDIVIRTNAVNFVKAWARPDLSQSEWLDGVSPYLAATALDSYKNVDPSRVPAHIVTGSPRYINENDDIHIVIVPTDAGEMRVVLNVQEKVTYIEPNGNRF